MCSCNKIIIILVIPKTLNYQTNSFIFFLIVSQNPFGISRHCPNSINRTPAVLSVITATTRATRARARNNWAPTSQRRCVCRSSGWNRRYDCTAAIPDRSDSRCPARTNRISNREILATTERPKRVDVVPLPFSRQKYKVVLLLVRSLFRYSLVDA